MCIRDRVHTDAWKRKLYDAVKQINKYPISTMLLPVLLVSFIVNPGDYQTLYPRMKQQKSVLPRNKHANSAKDRIETLYYAVVDAWGDLIRDWMFRGPKTDSTGAPLKKDPILEQMQKLRRTNCNLRLPVMTPSAVIDKLRSLQCFDGSTEDLEPDKLSDDLEKYMMMNGLRYDVRNKKRPLQEEILLDVAKLCNANSYVYYQCETIWDQRTREALDRLTTCGAISPRDDYGVEKTDEDYLDLYYEFCCQFQIEGADLNTLAFYKYHDPTLSFRILHEIKYFDQLLSQTSKVMTEITNEVRKEFGVPYWWGEDALSKARKLMIQQNKKWAQDCIEDLISNPIHFEYEGFKRFVEKTNPDILKQIPPELEAQMLVLIFENLLQMVCATVVESIRKYCVQVLHTYLE